MGAWNIDFSTYTEGLGVGRMGFAAQLRLPQVADVKRVVRLRDLKVITSLVPMTREFLEGLLRRVKTSDEREPFADARIRLIGLRPSELTIGQRFVYREKYQRIMEDVSELFRDFMVSPGGLSDIGAYVAFGLDAENDNALAYFVPPIIERHNSLLVTMDGIHRSFIAKQVGKTIVAILIDRIGVPFPCGMRSWDEAKVIPLADRPPDMRDRYFGMQQELFRDLKSVGIDG